MHSVGETWTTLPTLTGFLEPGAHLTRYLVDPGSRNHGSELTDDWGDLNAYKISSVSTPPGPPQAAG